MQKHNLYYKIKKSISRINIHQHKIFLNNGKHAREWKS